MPIRPENKAKYPKDWPAISARIRERAGNKCEECGVRNYEYGGRAPNGSWHKSLPLGEKLLRMEWPQPGDWAWCEGWPEKLRIVRIVLTVAHLNHDESDCRDENLKCWCQKHHNAYDASMRAAGIKVRRREKLAMFDLFGV